jgi:hypothetical protein
MHRIFVVDDISHPNVEQQDVDVIGAVVDPIPELGFLRQHGDPRNRLLVDHPAIAHYPDGVQAQSLKRRIDFDVNLRALVDAIRIGDLHGRVLIVLIPCRGGVDLPVDQEVPRSVGDSFDRQWGFVLGDDAVYPMRDGCKPIQGFISLGRSRQVAKSEGCEH